MNNVPIRKKLRFYHEPYGEQHPYEPLPFERFPRNPTSGELVQIGIETSRYPAAEKVWCVWTIEGDPTQHRIDAKKQSSDETKEFWKVELPAFSGGETVYYKLYAQNGRTVIESEDYKFGVTRWVDLVSVISIEETNDEINLMLSAENKELFALLAIQKDSSGLVKINLSTCLEKSQDWVNQNNFTVFDGNLGSVTLQLKSDPFELKLIRNEDGLVLQNAKPIQVLVGVGGSISQVKWTLESPADEAFYGFGERFNALNQRGNLLDNHVYGQYINQGKRSYIPIPFFLSSRGYGFWLMTESQAQFDMAATEANNWFFVGSVENESSLKISLFFQHLPQDIVKEFTYLTGKPQLPPPWVFGLWMSSNDWNSQQEIDKQIILSKSYDIPFSVMVIEAWSDEINFYIWNDAQYKQISSETPYFYKDYTYPNNGHWPNPKAMINQLHDEGARLVLWQIPVMKFGNPAENLDESQKNSDQEYALQKGFVVQKNDGSPHRIETQAPWFGNSLLIDFTNDIAADWWFKKREYLLTDLGIDGFKTDGGEHIWNTETRFNNGINGTRCINTYPVYYEAAYNNFLKSHLGNDYVLFSRAGYTGVQQFSCHWAGDEKSTWEAFRSTINAMLNVGLCGVSFIGWDIAGFAGPIPGSDLYLRATAFSVFCPIMQFHSDYNARRQPSKDRTPWNIQEQTGDSEVIPIFRKFTNLRMNLIPYILSQAKLSSHNGLPLMRTLQLETFDEPASKNFPFEYFFGDSLLVAPVVEEGISTQDVYLPAGDWCDFWSGMISSGSQVIKYEAPKDRIPVFQRRGSIVPLNLGDSLELTSPVGNSTEEIRNLVLSIFPGKASQLEVNQGKNKEPLFVRSESDINNMGINITLQGLSVAVDLVVHDHQPMEVNVNGIPIRKEETPHINESYWTWNQNHNGVQIHIGRNQGTVTVTLL